MRRGIAIVVALWLCASTVGAAVATHCAVCRQLITQRVYLFTSPYLAEKQSVCASCAELETACSICTLPIRGPHIKLSDGRLLCERERNDCVLTHEALEEVFADVKRDIFRMLAGHGTLPDKNVTIQLAGRPDLDRMTRTQRFPHDKNLTMGVTQTRRKGSEFEHRIFVLSGVRKSRAAAICAHEYTHAWLHQNLPDGRFLEVDTVEGFCELVAYKLMSDRNEALEKKVILENSYTSGEVNNLVKAEDRYRFYEIVKWIKTGVDQRIDKSNAARVLVRRHDDEPVQVGWQPVKATAVPDTLVLRGISGTPQRRFALVNDTTLAKGDQSKVRVGTTNVVVRCLDITDGSVILNVNGSERTELFLKKVNSP
jgi:hypothetical protein